MTCQYTETDAQEQREVLRLILLAGERTGTSTRQVADILEQTKAALKNP